jgi:uncharacterized delta-60 repeat protein
VQSDGKILIAGESYASEAGGVFTLVRYLTNGALDTSFGTGGIIEQAFGTGANAHALALQPDGKVLAGGYSTSADTGKSSFLVARYLANGTLDTSFGTNGSSAVSVGTGANFCHVLMLQSDGKIILSGGAMTDNNYDFVLVRFNSDGAPDTSFGTSGIVTTNFASGPHPSGEETAGGIIQPDGKIVVGGYSNKKFALARYLSTGALDTSFGVGGMVTTPIGTGNDDWIKSLALQSWDGKVVAAGFSKNGSTFNLTVARYLNDSGGISADDCIFNWAESTYPQYFAPAGGVSATLTPYYYRHYPETGNYLAASSADSHIWVLGPISGNSQLDVGSNASFRTLSGCFQ